MHDLEVFSRGVSGSFLAGLGTTLGALWVVFLPKPSARAPNAVLNCAAGVMLAATLFLCFNPPSHMRGLLITNNTLVVAVVIFGLLLGAVALYLIHRRHTGQSRLACEPEIVGCPNMQLPRLLISLSAWGS